jgi:myo-inositol-1(or 4)-monophosphatase
LQPWDIAAGIVMVKEAGGVITDMRGGNQMFADGAVVCANDPLHPQLLKLLNGVKA